MVAEQLKATFRCCRLRLKEQEVGGWLARSGQHCSDRDAVGFGVALCICHRRRRCRSKASCRLCQGLLVHRGGSHAETRTAQSLTWQAGHADGRHCRQNWHRQSQLCGSATATTWCTCMSAAGWRPPPSHTATALVTSTLHVLRRLAAVATQYDLFSPATSWPAGSKAVCSSAQAVQHAAGVTHQAWCAAPSCKPYTWHPAVKSMQTTSIQSVAGLSVEVPQAKQRCYPLARA